ncbi:restriction endonuclease subunit S [Cryobacterium sp. Hb1]|uniref:restriction endonuclease subunit S n=1 Tax=Cryobacterium sp. Hb1 TaxID=1259147 RepID=UPI0018E06A11|nr:restriction endonuclease subunit S [Cryobacterium sp. Hb1]
MVTAKDIRGGQIDYESARHTSPEAFTGKLTDKSRPMVGDVLLTKDGSIGRVAVCDISGICINQSVALLRPNEKILPKFLSYLLQAPVYQERMERDSDGSTIKHIYITRVDRMPVAVPDLDEQGRIVDVLGALDDKIAANTKLISTIDAHMALGLTAAISNGSRIVALGDIVAFHNRRRIPLSSRDRESRSGSVPYYGASGAFDTVDVAIFDQPLVLVGEDGSVINADGTPVVQYVWGPAWVNNHAHVLTGEGISTELLYFTIAREQVTTLVTGAVQPKINMGNLKRLELTLPTGTALQEIERLVAAETAFKRLCIEEMRAVAAIRDALLPQLMSGKLRVKDAEKLLAGVL